MPVKSQLWSSEVLLVVFLLGLIAADSTIYWHGLALGWFIYGALRNSKERKGEVCRARDSGQW